MKDFLKSTSVKVFLSVLLVVVLISLFNNNSSDSLLSSGVNSLVLPLSKVTAAATMDNADNKSMDELKAENAELAEENENLRAQLVDYYNTKLENGRLWKFYELKKENPDYTLIPAVVVRRDTNADFYSFTIDKGTSSGIKVEDPVVTDNGIIGWVSEADTNTSRIVTLLSPQTAISAKDIASSDTGVVTGSDQYSNKNQTMLTKLPTNHKVKEGDIISTTGISGLYPKDMIVGEVISIEYDKFDTSYYAVVEPYDVIRKLTEVAVIIDFTDQGEVLISESTDEE